MTNSTNQRQSDPISPLVVIGCSAGGFDALKRILPRLPKGIPFAVAIVIHLSAKVESALPDLFGTKCQCPVKEVEDKERIEPGTIYFAPAGYHLLVDPERTFSLSLDEPLNFSRPSIDVLFESTALAYRDQCIGVILTGANADGAEGLKCILDLGGLGVVEDPKLARHSAMPEAALALSPMVEVMTLEEIPIWLTRNAQIFRRIAEKKSKRAGS